MILDSLLLPCGQLIPNRLCKAAMTERLTDSDYRVNEPIKNLYKIWSKSGVGLHLSGNILIDPDHTESAGNIVVVNEKSVPSLLSLTKIVTATGAQFWAQLNHAGRQTSYLTNMRPKSASNVWLKRGGFYLKPRPMTHEEIDDVIHRFGRSAELCIEGGFTGIQIHAAHGYLLSQFLSPRTNNRSDEWGGSIENRARLLMAVVNECRQRIGPDKALSVKLNSADFQKGGFDEEDSLSVIKMLEGKIDLLEISGGTYETQAMMGEHKSESTQKREAYFLDFAKKVRTETRMPLMVTGGFRTRSVIDQALESGDIDMAGMARPFCTQAERIHDFLMGNIETLDYYFTPAKSKALMFSAEGGYYAKQIIDLAKGRKLDLNLSGDAAGRFLMMHELRKAISKRFFGKL